jgi:hypothetical protein
MAGLPCIASDPAESVAASLGAEIGLAWPASGLRSATNGSASTAGDLPSTAGTSITAPNDSPSTPDDPVTAAATPATPPNDSPSTAGDLVSAFTASGLTGSAPGRSAVA